jgi:hypothetical protein
VFASDCPFDPEKGTMYTRETLRIIDGIDMPKADKEKIWHGNLEAITGVSSRTDAKIVIPGRGRRAANPESIKRASCLHLDSGSALTRRPNDD